MPQTQTNRADAATLAGSRVAILRTSPPDTSAQQELESAGAQTILYPCAEIVPASDLTAFGPILQSLADGAFDYVLLPSLDSVLAFAGLMVQVKDLPVSVRVVTFGSAAQQAAIKTLAINPIAPDDATPAHAIAALQLSAQNRVLIVQSSHARPEWATLIARTGAQVETIAAYRALMPIHDDQLPALLWSGVIDAILFICDTDVRYFAARLKHDGGTLAMLDDVCVACLDIQTAATAKALGLRVRVTPHQPTPSALVAEVAAYIARNG